MTGTYRSRAPLRLSLAGGGTDLSPYSDLHGGAILNVTIDRYAYASITYRDDGKVVLHARDLGVEEVHSMGQLPTHNGLRLHRGVYNRIARQFLPHDPPSISLSTSIEAPPGSGLGSSSALVVAMVEVFREAFNLSLGLYDVAHLAFEIERIDLALDGGKQDQYAAAFGGMNFIEFFSRDRVIVNPLRVRRSILNELESSIVMCFSGQSRSSDAIIREQIEVAKTSTAALQALHDLKRDALDMKQAIIAGNMRTIAEILDHSWIAKKATSKSVSNPYLDALYKTARENGARAGKVSGAGGGGYMMFIADPDDRPRLIRALAAAGGVPDKVVFTHAGVESWFLAD
jgi:D-glycero-alpha-D-manno-heptose-7-phosphate kinase